MIFEKKMTGHKLCVFWFPLQSLSERDMIKNVYRCSRIVPVTLARF